MTTNFAPVTSFPSQAFMGFGYNPNLIKYGERVDMLSFFSWMKRLQTKFVSDWVIWDASGYYIVNKTPKKKLILVKELSGRNILDILVEELERPKRREIKENCDLRSDYLQRLMEISGIEGVYLDSRKVFREDSFYSECLDTALDFVKKLTSDFPELIGKIIPSTDNPVTDLYLPLEIAETIYLQKTKGVLGKFGPQTEQYIDESILWIQQLSGISYTTFRCSSGPRKPAYLEDKLVLRTQTPDLYVSQLLVEENYRCFVQNYLREFQREREPLVRCAIRMKNELERL